MISIMKMQDKSDLNDGLLHPIVKLASKEEVQKILNLEKCSKNLCVPKGAIVVLGFWKPGKYPKLRKVDFSPYFRIETSNAEDQILIQVNQEDLKTYLLFMNSSEIDNIDPNMIRGGIVIEGSATPWFLENTRTNWSYKQKLRDDLHVDPKKKFSILALQYWEYEKPEDILSRKDDFPVIEKPVKPKKKVGRPRKNQKPEG